LSQAIRIWPFGREVDKKYFLKSQLAAPFYKNLKIKVVLNISKESGFSWLINQTSDRRRLQPAPTGNKIKQIIILKNG